MDCYRCRKGIVYFVKNTHEAGAEDQEPTHALYACAECGKIMAIPLELENTATTCSSGGIYPIGGLH